MLADLLSVANVLTGLMLAVASLRNWRKVRGLPWAWVKLAYAIVGLYWAGLYVVVLLTPIGVFDSIWFGRTLVRPALTITLAIMASGAIVGAKRV